MRLASIVTLVLATVTYICLLPLGAFAHALIPADAISSSDEVIPYLLGSTDVMGPALGILFLLVLVSAAMSSIDSVLLVAAATIDQDILPRQSTTSAAVRRTRRWVVVVSLASAVVALSPFTKDIMSITAFSGSLYAACFLPALVVGLYWRRPSAYASLASTIIGAITVLGWYTARMQGWTRIHEVYIGIGVGLTVFLFAGCLLPPKSDCDG
jgi:Na+/pantothenate symporter